MIIAHMSEIDQQREMIDRMMYRVNTCIPGVIDHFYPATQTARVIPAIQTRMVDHNGKQTLVDMPAILTVPVCFPFGISAGYALTIPITKGDPCILVFSQRCIDNWYENGGIQPPETTGVLSRHHDMNDAFAFVCAPPKPDALLDWLMDGMEIRNKDRKRRVTVSDNGIEIVSDNGIEIVNETASIEITDKVKVNADVELIGALSVDESATFSKDLLVQGETTMENTNVVGNLTVGGDFIPTGGVTGTYKVVIVKNGIIVGGS